MDHQSLSTSKRKPAPGYVQATGRADQFIRLVCLTIALATLLGGCGQSQTTPVATTIAPPPLTTFSPVGSYNLIAEQACDDPIEHDTLFRPALYPVRGTVAISASANLKNHFLISIQFEGDSTLIRPVALTVFLNPLQETTQNDLSVLLDIASNQVVGTISAGGGLVLALREPGFPCHLLAQKVSSRRNRLPNPDQAGKESAQPVKSAGSDTTTGTP